MIEGGMDTAVDLAQSASNGGLTPEGVVTSVVTNMVGAFIGAPDTPSTTRNQLLDSATDNKAVKNAVNGSIADNKVGKNSANETPIFTGKSKPWDDGATPNSIYEQINPDGTVKSRSFYDDMGREFNRQDFDHKHFNKNTQQYYQPHEHSISYNEYGQVNGKSSGPLTPGYNNLPSK